MSHTHFKLGMKYPRMILLVFPQGKERPHYDVIIVGAGPAGATLGYYLGVQGRKVLLLEKKKFPRDKYCGDAVCKTGIEILHEMGVYQELIRDNKAKVVRGHAQLRECYQK